MKTLLICLFFLFHYALNSQVDTEIWMQARMNGTIELENGATTEFWGYSTYVPPTPGPKVFLPGPTLRLKQGDSVVVHFLNNSPEDHTIHFHGLDVIQGMDGVPNTSQAVEPDSIFDYGFKCTHAGNFMYHCHVLTSLHLAMGMYGMVVVDPIENSNTIYSGGPEYVQDYVFLCSEMNRSWNDNPISPGLFTLYEADYLMVNGLSGTQLLDGNNDIIGETNQNIALRLANIGYGSVRFNFPNGLNPVVHMSDGRVLPGPFNCDTLTLFPGERYSLIVNAASPLVDSIIIDYTDLRTNINLGTNHIPVYIGENMLEEIQQEALVILGNPVDDNLRLNLKTERPKTLFINNSFGQTIHEINLIPGVHSYRFPFPKGIYHLSVDGQYYKVLKH